MSTDRAEAVREFDLIVIGAGSGNSIIAPGFDDWSIALVDDGDPFGGTCLNAGCIPTKMFVRVADIAVHAREATRLGLSAEIESVDWPRIRDRIFARTDAISSSGLDYRVRAPNVTVLRDSHTFVDTDTLVGADGERIRAPRIVIAAGSRPRRLDVPGVDDPAVHDSDTIMHLDTLPSSLLIVGGGAIAVEFAHIFGALGSDVTLVTRSSRLLGGTDDDVSAALTAAAGRRWRHHGEDTVTRIDRDGSGLAVSLASGARETVDTVLVAIGRIPNTDRLGADAAGFDLHPDGRLVVDDRLRVCSSGAPLPNTYALGDIDSRYQLKHVANHQARIVSHNLLHPDDLHVDDLEPVPAAVFTHPQVAHFGLTEAEARNTGRDIVVARTPYSDTAYGWGWEDETSFCKLVVAAGSEQLLGAHIVGPEASILIQPLLLAASRRMSVRGLARAQYWPHPAASEVVENALLAAETELERHREERP